MGLLFPYKRTVRQLIDNSYDNSGNGEYIEHPDFAESPGQYIRAFLLIQKDLLNLFDYIEPSDTNLSTYSYRIHELLIRTCIEIEANFKAIFKENGFIKYDKKRNVLDFKITDYKKINITHHLSSYEVQLPNWTGKFSNRKPFENWKSKDTLPWYKAYNEIKHNRHENFHNASFDNLIDSVCGLVALLSSQFITYDFSPVGYYGFCGLNDGYDSAIGEYFRVKFPNDWKEEEKYAFEWSTLKDEQKKILTIDYYNI